MRSRCHETEDAAETVEQRWLTADYIVGSEDHSETDEVAVVESRVVG